MTDKNITLITNDDKKIVVNKDMMSSFSPWFKTFLEENESPYNVDIPYRYMIVYIDYIIYNSMDAEILYQLGEHLPINIQKNIAVYLGEFPKNDQHSVNYDPVRINRDISDMFDEYDESILKRLSKLIKPNSSKIKSKYIVIALQHSTILHMTHLHKKICRVIAYNGLRHKSLNKYFADLQVELESLEE